MALAQRSPCFAASPTGLALPCATPHRSLCRRRRSVRRVILTCTAAAAARLRTLTAGTRRGESCSPSSRTEIMELVGELEATAWAGAGAGPLESDEGLQMLDGPWELVFQQARMGEGVDGGRPGRVQEASIYVTDGEEGKRGRVLQNVDIARGVVENRAEGGGWLGTVLRVEAEFQKVEGSTSEVEVLFRKAFFGFRNLELAFPIQWIGGRGRLDTTYLSGEVRVGRGDKGTLFVLVRPEESSL